MRFIIREMDYEKPLAGGILRFERDGIPNGTLESWRVTRALDGYSFLRIDLDGRESKEGESCLFHLLLNPARQIERMKFRYFGSSSEIQGDVQFEEDRITLGHVLIDKLNKSTLRRESELSVEPARGFLFPSAVGLGLLASTFKQSGDLEVASLDQVRNSYLRQRKVKFEWGEKEELSVSGQVVTAHSCSIIWDDSQAIVWIDEYDWPLKVIFEDGLSAIENARVRYLSATANNSSTA